LTTARKPKSGSAKKTWCYEEIDRSSMFDEIVGSSKATRQVLHDVDKVAPSDSTVLILGETGTGKELIAHALHRRSKRADRAFIQVNCAAIPQSLIASELFEHEKGAFTGALQRRVGRFEAADGAHSSSMKSAICLWRRNSLSCGYYKRRRLSELGVIIPSR
jgi:transcriptional regulator with GAF, ATPase, and Fis domain